MSRPHDTIDIAELEAYKSESRFQSEIVYEARVAGWGLWYHPYDSRRSTSGFPDLTMVNIERGLAVMAELKTERGIVSPEQRGWLVGLRAAGIYAPLWRPSMSGAIADWLHNPAGPPPGNED